MRPNDRGLGTRGDARACERVGGPMGGGLMGGGLMGGGLMGGGGMGGGGMGGGGMGARARREGWAEGMAEG